MENTFKSARSGDIETIKEHLEIGLVEINETDNGFFSLFGAEIKYLLITSFFLFLNTDGNTLLHHAVLGNKQSLVDFLLTVPGVDVNAVNSKGQTVRMNKATFCFPNILTKPK